MSGLQPDGLPHSDISGSKVVCTSPKLFAAYHVLHSLLEPRHPPFALLFLFLILFLQQLAPLQRNCRLELLLRVALLTYNVSRQPWFLLVTLLSRQLLILMRQFCLFASESIRQRSLFHLPFLHLLFNLLFDYLVTLAMDWRVRRNESNDSYNEANNSSTEYTDLVVLSLSLACCSQWRTILPHHTPERRCSSRTFRYGYLVTT